MVKHLIETEKKKNIMVELGELGELDEQVDQADMLAGGLKFETMTERPSDLSRF